MSELGNTSIGKSNLLAFISKFLVHWSAFAGRLRDPVDNLNI
jgi:hypothetical protein